LDLDHILALAVRSGTSDVHLKAGLPPMFRISGSLRPVKDAPRLSAEEIGRMSVSMMSGVHKEIFKKELDVDLAYSVQGLGRFRVNVYQQRGVMGVVARVINSTILSIRDLHLPAVIEKIASDERGLILVTGTTGSGKSTTLAAMVDHINTNKTSHVMTIEDPIEYIHRDKRSLINQREVGADCVEFSKGLRAALRQDPDVILIGEMRDRETIEVALSAAETGHLVMSTLHTLNATETISRVISAFEPHHQQHVRRQLSGVLKAILSQRLVPRADGKGRVAAIEILRATKRVQEMIEDEERTKEIPDAMAAGATTYGMQTFDQALMFLLKNRYITYEEALRQCENPDDFALRVSGVSSSGGGKWADFEGKGQQEKGAGMEIERF
jgi:twitching motility protein PilT